MINCPQCGAKRLPGKTNCAQCQTEQTQLTPGLDFVRKYKLVEEEDGGWYSIAFRALEQRQNRQTLVREIVVPGDLAEQVERCKRIKSLPGITTILSRFVEGQRLYLVEEYRDRDRCVDRLIETTQPDARAREGIYASVAEVVGRLETGDNPLWYGPILGSMVEADTAGGYRLNAGPLALGALQSLRPADGRELNQICLKMFRAGVLGLPTAGGIDKDAATKLVDLVTALFVTGQAREALAQLREEMMGLQLKAKAQAAAAAQAMPQPDSGPAAKAVPIPKPIEGERVFFVSPMAEARAASAAVPMAAPPNVAPPWTAPRAQPASATPSASATAPRATPQANPAPAWTKRQGATAPAPVAGKVNWGWVTLGAAAVLGVLGGIVMWSYGQGAAPAREQPGAPIEAPARTGPSRKGPDGKSKGMVTDKPSPLAPVGTGYGKPAVGPAVAPQQEAAPVVEGPKPLMAPVAPAPVAVAARPVFQVLRASATKTQAGQSITIQWKVDNATSVRVLDGDEALAKPDGATRFRPEDSISVTVNRTTNYKVEASWLGGPPELSYVPVEAEAVPTLSKPVRAPRLSGDEGRTVDDLVNRRRPGGP